MGGGVSPAVVYLALVVLVLLVVVAILVGLIAWRGLGPGGRRGEERDSL